MELPWEFIHWDCSERNGKDRKPDMNSSIIIIMEFEHPLGMYYLDELFKKKIEIRQIIFTQNRDHDDLSRQFKERLGKDFIMPKMKDILNNRSIPCYFIRDMNSNESVEMLKEFSPDLIIQSAGGIIKENLLNLPSIGILNCHPGLFPKYRGCTCVEWAIYNNDPVGCTCHFITEKIDWGDVIMKETLKIRRGDSYNDVRKKSYQHCAKVLAHSIKKIIQNKYIPGEIRLDISEKRSFKPISDEKMLVVKRMLREGKYNHYVD